MSSVAVNTASTSRSLWSGVLVGLGVAGFVDETVFHQLLHWHHFYDRSTAAVGLVSDGLFHLVSTAVLAWGLLRLWEDRIHPYAGWRRRLWAGILLGGGAFNLYDGVVQHKVLRLHQVRYGVEQLPYDVGFIAAAVVVLAAGIALTRTGRPVRRPGSPG